MVWRGPKRLDFRVVCGPGRWVPEFVFFDLFSRGLLKRFFSIFGEFSGILGSQNGSRNQFLGNFLAMFFSSALWHRFLVVFWRLRTLKICTAPRREHDFCKIDVFKKQWKNV